MSKKVRLVCQQCDKEFFVFPSWSHRKCCSKKCKDRLLKKTMKGKNSSPWIKKVCTVCKSPYEVMPYRFKSRFCSRKCMWEFRKTQYLAINSILYKNGKGSYRRLAFSRFEHKCSICKTTNGQLDVHHIDKDRNNNSLDNLIIVCVKCHKTFHPR